MGLIIVIVVVVLILLWVVVTYNSLVKVRNKVKDQWAQVDVHLKRRFDLIPNLVESVKGYAKHESETLTAVIHARNTAASAINPRDEIEANNVLTGTLGKLFALAEAYPNLKADTSFVNLQTELSKTEDKIAYARQFYNDSVYMYQNKVEMFPAVIIAGLLGFKKKEFFAIPDTEKANVQVRF